MAKRLWLFILLLSLSSALVAQDKPANKPQGKQRNATKENEFLKPTKEPPTAMFAGGCFWSMESAFEHLPGVLEAESGYAGGSSKNPTYDDYAKKGHREVVVVHYDPDQITYAGLVEYFIKHINPLDKAGTFIDRGENYAPAIYVANEEEKKEAHRVIHAIDGLKVFRKKINVPVLNRPVFWMAEEYHQNYHRTHEAEYANYRAGSGRDEFIHEHWGAKAEVLSLPGSRPDSTKKSEKSNPNDEAAIKDSKSDTKKPAWVDFKKPAPEVLKKKLNRMEYQVTQSSHTEPAFQNKFWNHHEDGLYVDVVSGEPLFSSNDKFDSGTGWPSFVQPIQKDAVFFKEDTSETPVRVEVRSKIADSHLGHVFDDGPRNRGGYRFCINSASLRFIPVDRLEAEGYGDYLKAFSQNQADEVKKGK